MEARCIYGAPYFATEMDSRLNSVTQGNCHHWDCPRCGQLRAAQEYGRIVAGCREVAKNADLLFLTITCKGRDLTLDEAERRYLEWTNRFLSNARQRAKRSGQSWQYVQITERQKRAFPHSHILTTFNPNDLRIDWRADWVTDKNGIRHNEWKSAYRSDWMLKASVKAGLGTEYDISVVDNVEAASRYVAKYLFKDTALTEWPKGWKRVRYSQSWPKLPKVKTDALLLLTDGDMINLGICSAKILVKSAQAKERLETAFAKYAGPYPLGKVVLVGD